MRADYTHDYHPADTSRAGFFGVIALLGFAAVLLMGLMQLFN